MEHINDLATEKLSRLMRRYSIPCIISLLVAALYNIVDQIFIANASYLGSYGNAANKAAFIFLQAMGKAVESTALSMIREIVFGVGFALLLPRFFALDGVLYSMPVSDVLTFLVTLYIVARTLKELGKDGKASPV